ncbi:MAG: hypothetical protein MMC33_004367 [Icmadophila ericetorum]|nr:hypothetical protein [Icmadophila ericetorum]
MDTLSTAIVTFNCGREEINPKVFSRHLVTALSVPNIPDLILVSLQEVAPIAYAFLGGSSLKPYLDRVRESIDLAGGRFKYVNIISANVGMTALMAFAKEDIAENVQWIETAGVGFGVQEMGNKGAVGLRMGYTVEAGETVEITFVAAHLAPMEHALERRNEDWKSTVQHLVFTPIPDKKYARPPPPKLDVSATDEDAPLLPPSTDCRPTIPTGIYTPKSYLFLAGDLNYRTSLSAPLPLDTTLYPQPTTDPISIQHYTHLLLKDQLAAQISLDKTCHGLHEAPITFEPTYKYSDRAREGVAEKEAGKKRKVREGETEPEQWGWATHRWPSWCDRILYLPQPKWMQSKSQIQIHNYTALPLMSTSDHRPVALTLSLPLTPIPSPPEDFTGLNEDATDGNASGEEAPSGTKVTDVRLSPPYPIDPLWREKRTIARRKEVVVGVGAYIGLTWEGNGAVLAVMLGIVGGWALIWGVIENTGGPGRVAV